MLFLSFIS